MAFEKLKPAPWPWPPVAFSTHHERHRERAAQFTFGAARLRARVLVADALAEETGQRAKATAVVSFCMLYMLYVVDDETEADVDE